MMKSKRGCKKKKGKGFINSVTLTSLSSHFFVQGALYFHSEPSPANRVVRTQSSTPGYLPSEMQ